MQMKPSIIVHLDKRYEKKTGVYPITIRVTWCRVQRYYSTGQNLSESEFAIMMNLQSRGKEVNLSTRRRLQDIALKCEAKKIRAVEVADSLPVFDFTVFKKRFENKQSSDSVYFLYELKIADLEQSGQYGTSTSYATSMNSLKKFAPKLKLREVTHEFLRNYEQHLRDGGKTSSTVGIYLRPLRHVINQAISEGSLSRESYPFGKGKYMIPASRNIKKALSASEIASLLKYRGEPGTWYEKARDFFIFSYLASGMNMKDILHLRYRNIQGKSIVFQRAKTARTSRSNSSFITCVLNAELERIIERHRNTESLPDSYIFPVLEESMSDFQKMRAVQQFIQMVNTYLKKIAKELGIERNLTTYFARHTFATVLKRNGFSPMVIKDQLGHASFSTTEKYLDSIEDDVRESISETLLQQY